MTDEDALFVGAPRARAFFEQLRVEFPGVRVVSKAHDPLSGLIDRALRVITLGGQRRYLDGYTTVLGRTIYVPTTWNARGDVERLITLRHEAVHLRQFARYGRVLMSFLYAVPLFPFGLALGRARIEWEAYRETLRATAELEGLDAARDPRLHAHIVRQFTSSAYGFMWPFPRQVQRWIDEALDELGANFYQR